MFDRSIDRMFALAKKYGTVWRDKRMYMISVKEKQFLEIARIFCALWTQDYRNAANKITVDRTLAKARGDLYTAYFDLVKSEEGGEADGGKGDAQETV